MKRRRFLGAMAALSSAPVFARASGTADLIVTGATIHTVDDRAPVAEAFAVANGRFVYVGSLDGALAMRGSRTQVVDLRGRTVLPGLIDAHAHLTSVGLDLSQVSLHQSPSYDDVIARTVAFYRASSVLQHTADAWVAGDGWDQNLWPGKAFPTREKLSAAFPDRPVLLERVDGHALLVNAKAMQLAGIDRHTADPQGGRILRDANGDPTGVFVDDAQQLIYRVVPQPTHAQLVEATRAAMKEANRWGLTTVAEPGVRDAQLAAQRELLRAREFTLRNYAMLSDDDALLEEHFRTGIVDGDYDGRLWIRAVKMYADGALGSRGAALLAPYSDDPGNTGLITTPQAHIQDVTERALAHGFQVCVHAIGDRGNRMTLDAYEAALRTVPSSEPRLRIEHAQVLAPSDIPRFAQLGIIPSMQTTHQISDMGWAQARLGPQRVRGAYAWRSLLDTGVIIANGTDAPVEPLNTLRTFHAGISRQNEANQPPDGWYVEQRMTRDETLKSMTIWAAHANFQEAVLGSITVGKHADFVVMDRDWMSVPAEEVMATKILATYSEGEQVYDGANAVAFEPRPARFRANCCARR
jgi:predicted amidohydrolase YtcJ